MLVSSTGNKSQNLSRIIFFLASFLLSAFGYEFLFFILTVHVYDISHKALAVGIFTAITFFPKMFSPFYGIFVDRYNRKVVLGLNAGLAGILVFVLGFTQQIYWIYTVWFIATIFIMFINNARTALMADIMPKDNYIWGNSAVLTILNGAKLLAPLIAGFIMQSMDKKILIVFSSCIYFLCMIVSFFIKFEEQDRIEIKKFSDNLYYIKEGIKYIFDNNGIKTLGFLGFFWRLFLGMQFSFFVVYVTKYLGKTEVEYGVFLTTLALGSLIGSLVGPFAAKKLNEKALIMTGLILHFASFSLLGLINQYNLSLVVGFISYFIFYITMVGIHSVRDKSTKTNIRGRVYGASTAIFTPPTIISILVSGYFADIYGIDKVFIITGILATISVIFIISNLQSPVDVNREIKS
jgi:DHA3 family macrolide efflux protein-like MFS transporter